MEAEKLNKLFKNIWDIAFSLCFFSNLSILQSSIVLLVRKLFYKVIILVLKLFALSMVRQPSLEYL